MPRGIAKKKKKVCKRLKKKRKKDKNSFSGGKAKSTKARDCLSIRTHYGTSPRKMKKKIEISQPSKYTCFSGGKNKMKRQALGSGSVVPDKVAGNS